MQWVSRGVRGERPGVWGALLSSAHTAEHQWISFSSNHCNDMPSKSSEGKNYCLS